MIFIKNLFWLHPKKTNWCNKCPKCVFVFLILSNFLTLKELETIFWKNLFESKSLENTFAELIWLKKHKPFECVWTIEESVLSFYRAIKKYPENNFYILEKFKKDILKKTKSLNMESVEKEFL